MDVLPVHEKHDMHDKRPDISVLLSDCFRLTIYELKAAQSGVNEKSVLGQRYKYLKSC